jgi:hypothetical protein
MLRSTYLCYDLNYKNIVKPSFAYRWNKSAYLLEIIHKFVSHNHFDKVSKRNIEFLQPLYTWNYFVWRNIVFFLIYFEENTKLSVTDKILLEEIAKYEDTNELKEEQRNDLLYLVEISVLR